MAKINNNPDAIATKVVNNLEPKIMKIIHEHIAGAIQYAGEEGYGDYGWVDDICESDMSWELAKLIGDYLETHLSVEAKFTFKE